MNILFDAIVLRAGIAGTATAWFFRTEGLRIALLDSHVPGWGALGRNPGFLWLQTKAAGVPMDPWLRARAFADGLVRYAVSRLGCCRLQGALIIGQCGKDVPPPAGAARDAGGSVPIWDSSATSTIRRQSSHSVENEIAPAAPKLSRTT